MAARPRRPSREMAARPERKKEKKRLIQHANDEIPRVAVVHLSVLLIRRNLGLQQSRVVRFLTATYNNKQQQD